MTQIQLWHQTKGFGTFYNNGSYSDMEKCKSSGWNYKNLLHRRPFSKMAATAFLMTSQVSRLSKPYITQTIRQLQNFNDRAVKRDLEKHHSGSLWYKKTHHRRYYRNLLPFLRKDRETFFSDTLLLPMAFGRLSILGDLNADLLKSRLI